MSRGSTRLDSAEYDDYLAKKGDFRELRKRKEEKRRAHNSKGEGWHFGIDDHPVKVRNSEDFRRELGQRGLAIYGEYKGEKRCPKMSEMEAQWHKQHRK